MPVTTTTTTTTTSGGETTTTTTTTTASSGSPAEGIPPASGAPQLPVPKTQADITPEWVTAALRSRGNLSPHVSVAKIDEIFNVGEGRGYANYSWAVTVSFDGPVSPDTPRKFVLKQLNQEFGGIWTPGPMR